MEPDPFVERICTDVVDVAIKLHTELGPGLFETVYREFVAHDLRARGYHVDVEVVMPLTRGGLTLRRGYRIDIWVERRVVLEIKTVDALLKVHFAQLSTYLKMSGSRSGFILNFDSVPMKHGIRRLDRDLDEPWTGSRLRPLELEPVGGGR